LLALLGSIAFSGKAIIVKLAYRYGVDAVTLIMYRMLFALPIFAVMAWWASRGKPPLTRKDWLGVLGLGLTGYYLASFLDFAGLAYISASLERLILYLNPTLVVMLGWVLYRRGIHWGQAVGMLISYCGVVLVFGHEANLQGADAAWGTLLVFLSAVSYAIYLVYSGELPAAVRGAAALQRGRGGARGDLAVGAQRHAVHGRARAHGDDGDRARGRRHDRADRHGGAAVHHPHGRLDPGRTLHGVGGRGHGAGHRRHFRVHAARAPPAGLMKVLPVVLPRPPSAGGMPRDTAREQGACFRRA
jgi:uncharacterized membrane protein